MNVTTETTVTVSFDPEEGRIAKDIYSGDTYRVRYVTFLWQEAEPGDLEQPFVDVSVKGRKQTKAGKDSVASTYSYAVHGRDARQLIQDLAAHLADEGRLPRWVQERVQDAYEVPVD